MGDARVNVYGVVCSFSHRHQSKGRDMTACVSLVDESQPNSDDAVSCNFFVPTRDGLPAPLMVGDIMRVHRAKVSSGMISHCVPLGPPLVSVRAAVDAACDAVSCCGSSASTIRVSC